MSESRPRQLEVPEGEAPASLESRREVDVVRVAHVVRRLDYGGVETWLLNLIRHFDHRRFHFTVVTLDAGAGALDGAFREAGADIVPCPLRRTSLGFGRRFAAILRERECDVLHAHVLFFSGWLARLARRAGVGIRIVHAHNTGDGYPPWLHRRAYRAWMRRLIRKYTTARFAVSPAAGRFVFGARQGAAYDVMPCAIDLDAFRSTPLRARLLAEFGLDPTVRVIGHVGSFRAQKNHEFLLQAVAPLLTQDPGLRLMLVGAGLLQPAIRDLADRLGISQRVIFAGARGDVPILAKGLFDLVVMPSRFEGLGLSAVEAQCAGVPVLVSEAIPPEIGIIPELVHRESLESGLLVWTQRARQLLGAAPYDKRRALAAFEGGPFDIAGNVQTLMRVYQP